MNCEKIKECVYLKALVERIKKMEETVEIAEKEIKKLKEENEKLKEENRKLKYNIKKAYSKVFKTEREKKDVKRGAPSGHFGKGRKRPKEITEYIDIYPTRCKRCDKKVRVYKNSFYERVIEDIEIIKKVRCYRIHYGYCKGCRKIVYPEKSDLLPNSRIGVNARAIGGYFRYIGIPYRKIEDIFKEIFNLEITHPSILNFDREYYKNSVEIYEVIKENISNSDSENIDETGWRVDGRNFWLWVFANKSGVFYKIENQRNRRVIEGTIGKEYNGTIISDFYSCYNKVKAKAKQRCISHLLEEIKEIQKKNDFSRDSSEYIMLEDLKALFKSAIDVWKGWKSGIITFKELEEFKEEMIKNLIGFLNEKFENKDIKRLKKRIIRHNEEILLFLENPSIEPTNNLAERMLRPLVIMRKITFGNRSYEGARNLSVIFSILETGKLNGNNPLKIFKMLTQKDFIKLPLIRAP